MRAKWRRHGPDHTGRRADRRPGDPAYERANRPSNCAAGRSSLRRSRSSRVLGGSPESAERKRAQDTQGNETGSQHDGNSFCCTMIS